MIAQPSLMWEYRDFTYQQWQPDELWCCLAGAEKGAEQQARQFVWEKAGQRIEAEIAQWRDDGWEPADLVGPQAIVVCKSIESAFKFTFPDVLLWILTFGIALVMQVILNFSRQYVTYKPVEFHISMIRCNKAQVNAASMLVKTEELRI